MAKATTKKVLNDDGDIVVEKEFTMEEVMASLPIETPTKPIKQVIKKDEPKTYVFRLISNASANDKRQYPPRFMLANTDIVFDEETNSKRGVRYLPGVNTIWVDEQENLPENLQNKRPNLSFMDGYMYVPALEKMLVKYLSISNRCVNAENRDESIQPTYELMNFEAVSKKKMESVKTKHEAMKVALSASDDMMLEHAEFLGITKLNAQGIVKDMDEMRVEYVSISENRPDVFLKTYGNPTTKAYALIKKAFEDGTLSSSIIEGQVHWSETRSLVAVIPSGEKLIEYLVKFCFKDGEGEKFYDRLKDTY
jgi:hypothetical protein